ncbi:Arc family DNA-binding protein [Komagataeibacter sp. FNDCF1]|uniref:Arc family DNA-binding protein n=1 Tax=Komagataeibacter sp. FNDCF1 TaxID=2878681 RepID=UPI001E51933B|nr:Arc family DNA-binding protein [Komagataeibacter sp. FNDCF1]MCE2563405.1 Arc family DNA-binding protein [Komagataeibacter sp. FNDCF1]
MSDDAHFRLRIPRHLKEWVEEKAKANNRSINAEILSCIELAKSGMVLHEDKARARLDTLIEEAIRPFYAKVDSDLAAMKTDLQDFLSSKRKD